VDAESLALCADGLLGRRKSARIRAHVAGCAHCAAAQARLDEIPALLARVPQPPLPLDIAARLDAALSAESARRSSHPAQLGQPEQARRTHQPAAEPPGAPPRTPGPRPARRGPLLRSPVRVRVLATAGVLVAVGGVGYGVAQLMSSPPSTSSASSAAAPNARHNSAGSGASAMSPAAGVALPVIASGTDYRHDQLDQQVARILQSHPRSSLGRPGALPLSRGASDPALSACVTSIAPADRVRLVDESKYQGQQATVIVVDAYGGHPETAFVVGSSCSAARSDIVAQAVLTSTR
jgi:hypothetical protein